MTCSGAGAWTVGFPLAGACELGSTIGGTAFHPTGGGRHSSDIVAPASEEPASDTVAVVGAMMGTAAGAIFG